MDKRFLIFLLTLILIFIGFSGCFGPTSTEYFNEEYDVDENTVIKVSTINGQIEIIGWDENKISLNAVKKSNFAREELDYVKIDVNESDDEFEVNVYYTGTRLSQPSVDLNIKVPSYVIVERALTSNGAIQISDVKGDVVASTSNGGIFIDNVDGFVLAHTSNGRIEIENTKGIMDLKSSNSGINAEIFDFKEDIEVSTSNGGITLYINPNLNADLDITTSNGYIMIDDNLDFSYSLNEDKHKQAELGDGGDQIIIQTSNGNIKIYELDI
jgi:DUF4097 and DUF4098 domain-containing protein YvlB